MSVSLSQSRTMSFIPTADRQKALAFYRDLLELDYIEDNGFALVFRMGQTTLRITETHDFTPQSFTVFGWEVDNVAEAVSYLAARGIKFERFPSLLQDENNIWTAPDGALIAWFRDQDGNLLSIVGR